MPIGTINVNLGDDLSELPALAAAYDQLSIMSDGLADAWQGRRNGHSSPL